ncbi:hypothetical protein [Haloarchaeobius sp. DFWS5]|uniref:hypothetical protein n=1 Tax=Haloarchaeobius sp. DFWS5 TaxID=3446114 RepID=UPI003EB98E56
MSVPSGWYGGYTIDVERDGVVVRKGLDLTTLPLPALKFGFRSARDSAVGVRLTEQLPEGITFDHVAVHTDHGGIDWSAFEDGRLVYTGAVPPGGTVCTLFMVWLERPEHVYRFLTEPYLRVASDPNAPSLRPVGVETDLRIVDGRFAKADRFASVVEDVERSLSARAATPPPAPSKPSVTVEHGTTAWPHPVHRGGEEALDLPTEDAVTALAPEAGGDGDHFVRVGTQDTYHGGGPVVVAQELANAFEIRGRRVVDDEVVEAVVATDGPTRHVATRLLAREQVSDVLVSPLFESDAPEPMPAVGPGQPAAEDASSFSPVESAELEAELDATDFPDITENATIGDDGDDSDADETNDDDTDDLDDERDQLVEAEDHADTAHAEPAEDPAEMDWVEEMVESVTVGESGVESSGGETEQKDAPAPPEWGARFDELGSVDDPEESTTDRAANIERLEAEIDRVTDELATLEAELAALKAEDAESAAEQSAAEEASED